MNRMLRWTFLVLVAAGVADTGCRKHDIRTVTVQVPDMENQEQARTIQDAFIQHTGIKTVQPDLAKHEVRVTYNSMVIAVKNVEYIIANAGFDANAIPAQRPPAKAAAMPAPATVEPPVSP